MRHLTGRVRAVGLCLPRALPFLFLAVALLTEGLFPSHLFGQGRGRGPATDLDVRPGHQNARPDTPPGLVGNPNAQRALGALRANNPDLIVRYSSLTGGVSRMHGISRALTGPSSAPPRQAALSFIQQNLALFNLGQNGFDNYRVSRDFVTQHNGVTHLTFQQQVNGIDIFGTELRVNVTRDGEILNIGGEPIPLAAAGSARTSPVIQSDEAFDVASQSAEVTRSEGRTITGLVYFPLGVGALRLAWDVTVQDADSPNAYRTIVDAENGLVLWRENQTYNDHFPAHGLVYTNDGPNPSTPTDNSGTTVSRADLPFSGTGFFPHDDDHYDWWAGGARTTTSSNNVIARDDQAGDNETTLGFQPTANATEDFSFDLDLSMEPETEAAGAQNVSAAIANLFYWNNRVHDIAYRLGFDEAAGNFQTSNFGAPGLGGDAVRADAQDNSMPAMGDPDLCNANFNSGGGDGNVPRMQMYLCDKTTPKRDSSLDNSVIVHEYGHGIHARLVPTSGHQRMNEGWSDYFALAFLSESGDDLQGKYGLGHWLFGGTGDGIRRQAYSTDQSVFTRTYADISDNSSCAVKTCSNDPSMSCTEDDDCGAGNTCDSLSCQFHFQCDSPPNAIDQGDCTPSVHNTGELWAETLWLARANLLAKYGFQTGNTTMNRLVLDGMKESVDDPTFLDSRDGILTADLASNSGVNQCLLWDAFAKMGLGKSALTLGVNDINPVEAFDTPAICTPNILVNAPDAFGTVCAGGFSDKTLTVSNTGTGELIINDISRTSGSADITLDPAPSFPVVVNSGSSLGFTVRCSPTSQGSKTATITIESNDPDQPQLDIEYTCDADSPEINVTLADEGAFGDVCGGDQADLTLQVLNEGSCALTISGMSMTGASAGLFELPGNTDYPLEIAAGETVDFPVRFAPSSSETCSDTNIHAASVRILHNDPDGPDGSDNDGALDVGVEGVIPCPDLNVALANSGSFGQVCLGDQADLDLTLFNQGKCDLTIDSISIDNPNFILPANTQYPLVLSHDADFTLPVRFQPGPEEMCSDESGQEGVITIDSDSPGEEMLDIEVSGSIPCPNLVIDPGALTGLYSFPATVVDTTGTLGCFSEKPVVVRNTGACPLTIDGITADGVADPEDFNVIAPTQFPIILPPGEETLVANVRFTPQSDADPMAPNELLGTLTINTNDPDAGGTADLCGQSAAQSGVQLLVTDVTTGTPLPLNGVDRITLTSKGKNTPSPVNITLTDAPVLSAGVCGNTILYHLDAEILSSAGTTGNNPKSSYQTTAKEGNLQTSQSVNLQQCELAEFQLQLTGNSGGEPPPPPACMLAQKGDSCSMDSECCSNKCSGKPGSMTCK